MMKTGFAFLPICAMLLAADAHDAVHTLSEIKWDDESITAQVKMDVGDLEQVIKTASGSVLDFKNEDQRQANTKALVSYAEQHYSISLGDQRVALNWLGFEVEKADLWAFAVAQTPSNAGAVVVTNTLLNELHHEMQHVIHFTVNDSVRTALGTHQAPSVTFEPMR